MKRRNKNLKICDKLREIKIYNLRTNKNTLTILKTKENR